jgi:hypothetical protein
MHNRAIDVKLRLGGSAETPAAQQAKARLAARPILS